MTNRADAAIGRLMELHPKGFDLSLGRIRNLLERLGNPQDRLPPVIHIAGTNGKGSTSAFTRALLEAAGYKVHVHTSPHLVNWHERYRLAGDEGGKFVSDAVLADAIERVAEANKGEHITVFEILSAVAFVLFSEHPADAVILEVGLGGRFDATNVIAKPAVSVIMPISIDHQSYLGDTIEKIATEKAGIIKDGCPVVIGYQPYDKARDVLETTAIRHSSPYVVYGQDFFAYEEHGRFIHQNQNGLIDLPLPALRGQHQLSNAAAAIEAVRMAGFEVDHKAAEYAMAQVEWPARMQRLTHGQLFDIAPSGSEIWLDGGHNPGAGLVIAETLSELQKRNPRPLIMITGMINTKEAEGYFAAFKGIARQVYTVPIGDHEASIPNDVLAADAQKAGLSAKPAMSVEAALKSLAQNWNEETLPRILIGGSLYLAGEVLRDNGTPPI